MAFIFLLLPFPIQKPSTILVHKNLQQFSSPLFIAYFSSFPQKSVLQQQNSKLGFFSSSSTSSNPTEINHNNDSNYLCMLILRNSSKRMYGVFAPIIAMKLRIGFLRLRNWSYLLFFSFFPFCYENAKLV